MKQRLIGAAFLIALGVIFLPMLLDGSGRKESQGLDITIPPEPEYTFENRLPNRSKQDASDKSSTLEPTESVEQDTVAPNSVSDAPEPAPKPTTDPAAETAQQAIPKAEPEPASQPSVAAPVIKNATSEASPAQSQVKRGWVVQVGSFSHRDNAKSLLDKLSSAGFPAFIEDGPNNGKDDIYRVKVGPEEIQKNAEQLQVRLLTEAKIKGIVVSFP